MKANQLTALIMLAMFLILSLAWWGRVSFAEESNLRQDLLETNKFQVIYRTDSSGNAVECWLVNKKQERLTTLESFSLYHNNKLKKMKLVSKQGFSFSNIPMDNNYFYNECISAFLKLEEYLAVAKAFLEDKGYKTVAITGLEFQFTDNPVIDSEKMTIFWHDDHGWVYGIHFVGTKKMIVTDTLDFWGDYTPLHEYVHACGYDNSYHGKLIFDGANLYKLSKWRKEKPHNKN